MPKWKSEIVKEPPKNEDGTTKEGMTTLGRVVWVPANKAAEAHPLVEKAAEAGKYDKKKAANHKQLRKKMKEEELKHAKVHFAS